MSTRKKTPGKVPRRKDSVAETEKVRDQWLADLNRLFAQATAWGEEQGWWTSRDEKEISEERIGAYRVPVLRLQSPTSRLIMEPVARHVVGAEGRVDLCVFPSWDHLALVRKAGEWRFCGNGEPEFDRAWSKENLLAAAELLAAKA